MEEKLRKKLKEELKEELGLMREALEGAIGSIETAQCAVEEMQNIFAFLNKINKGGEKK